MPSAGGPVPSVAWPLGLAPPGHSCTCEMRRSCLRLSWGSPLGPLPCGPGVNLAPVRREPSSPRARVGPNPICGNGPGSETLRTVLGSSYGLGPALPEPALPLRSAPTHPCGSRRVYTKRGPRCTPSEPLPRGTTSRGSWWHTGVRNPAHIERESGRSFVRSRGPR